MNYSYDILFDKIGLGKLNKKVEVTFEVLEDLPFYKSLNARKYASVIPTNDSDTPSNTFNKLLIPENVFECMPNKCKNTGTFVAGVAGKVVYRIPFDATRWSSGVLTFYVKDAGSTAIDVLISDSNTFANADKYTVAISDIKAGADGFKPVIIDLSQTPTAEVGSGWTASENGAYVSITTIATTGISTITVFNSLLEFETSSVVKMGCLTEIGGDYEVEAAESTCLQSGYDQSSEPSIERTITGNMITPNYWVLNPLVKKGKATTASIPMTLEYEVKAGDGYGVVTLADINPNECGFVAAQIADSCNVSDSQLYRLVVPTPVKVDERHFFILNNEDGSATLYFNTSLVGTKVKIAYPKLVDVEELVGDFEFLGEKRVRMTETVTYITGDGRIDSQHINRFDNVLITTFPDKISQDETEFSFTVNIQKGKDGHIFHRYHVID